MKNVLRKITASCNKALFNASLLLKKHEKTLTLTYLLAVLTSCSTAVAFADDFDDYPLWRTTQAVLNIIYPIFVVIGILLLIIGIILLLINRFNEQSLTGPLIILAVGVALIVIRALLGSVVTEIAFEQMYPDAKWNDGHPQEIITSP